MYKKESTMIVTACVMLLSGVVMCFLSFALAKNHEVADSVLWYLGQCIVYASSVFGIGSYVDYKIDKRSMTINQTKRG